MKKILCLIDFSKASGNAARYAAWLAREKNASLSLLHVLQTQSLLHGLLNEEKAHAIDVRLEEAEQQLQELKEKLERKTDNSDAELVCEVLTGEGLLLEVTEYYCEQYDFDLVVMGTTGYRADSLEELLVGSNTVEFFEKLKWPILSVPRTFKGRQLHKIVFATDYQEKDLQVSAELAALADSFYAQVHVLHVNPKAGSEAGKSFVDFGRAMVETAGYDRLHFSQIEEGDVEKGVLTYAEEIKADMLVLTGKPSGFFKKFFGQSLTKLAAYHARVPLLIFTANWKPDSAFFTRHSQTQKR